MGKYHNKISRAEKLINIILFIHVLILFLMMIWMAAKEYRFSTKFFDRYQYMYEGIDDLTLLSL